MDTNLLIVISVSVLMGYMTAYIVVYHRVKPKRKHKAKFIPLYPVGQAHRYESEDDEVYWQNQIRQAEDNINDAQREHRDVIEDYMRWRRDKAQDEWRITFNFPGNNPFADDDAPPPEPDNKLLGYLRKITDEDSN